MITMSIVFTFCYYRNIVIAWSSHSKNILIPLLLLLYSCGGEEKIQTIPINLNSAQMMSTSSFFDELIYIPLETPKGVYISDGGADIDEIAVDEDYIVVLENIASAKTLYVFDREGKYLWHKVDPMEGPENFIGARDIAINSKKGLLEVFDGVRGRLLYFSLADGHLSNVQYLDQGFYFFAKLGEEEYLLSTAHKPVDSGQEELYYHNLRTGEYSEMGIKTPNYLLGLNYNRNYFSAPFNENVLYFQLFTPHLYKIAVKGKVTEYFIDFGDILPDPKTLESFANGDNVRKMKIFNNNEYSQGVRFAHLANDKILFTFFHGRTYYWCTHNIASPNTDIRYFYKGRPSRVNDIDSGPIPKNPFSSFGNHLVFMYRPAQLIEHLEKQREKLSESEFGEMYSSDNAFYNIVQGLDPYDNFVILLARLKDN